ncbi:MAG: zf-TFIIB domain-containing protein [Pseudomonadales bacterium]|nr:zf-TFIIB domain-containing protein [Pseudomonadales bacterium]
MECPKCHSAMEEKTLSTLKGGVTVDRCTNCHGIWFDSGEAEALKEKWMSDYVDSGNPEVGREHNAIQDIDCPRCGKPMEVVSDPSQPHIQYEACAEHGMYFDAGEFTDYKYDTLMDIFRDFVFKLRNR